MSSIINEAHARKFFSIERPKIGMGLSYEFDQDERKGPQTNRKDSSSTFTEELAITTQGWVYHPALVNYSLAFFPGWEQNRQTDSGGSNTLETRKYFNNYFAELNFLEFKPYSLYLSGNRERNTIQSNFAERSIDTVDSYNAVFSLKYPILPTSLSYTHTEGRQTGFFETFNDADQLTLSLRNKGMLGNSYLIGVYDDLSNNTNNDLKNTIHQKTDFTNIYDFADNNDIRLNSRVHYEDTDSSNILTRHYSIHENFRIKHNNRLETSYILRYTKDNRYDKTAKEPSRSEIKSVAFRLGHRLYENLDTNLLITTSESNDKLRRTSFHEGRIDWNYRRKIPIGTLSGNVGYNYSIRDQRVTESEHGTVWKNDELHHLVSLLPSDILGVSADPIIEDIENIVISSIKVTSDTLANNFGTEYVVDQDYIIIKNGSAIRIARTVLSTIPGPGDVYVHYRYIANPAFDYELLRERYGVQLELWDSMLLLYYGYNRANQDLIAGQPPADLFNSTTHFAGGKYQWKWNRTSFYWKDSDSIFNPTEEWIAREVVTLRPGINNFLEFAGSISQLHFKDSGGSDKSRSLSATFRKIITGKSQLLINSSVIDITGTSQDSTDTLFLLKYLYSYRIWTFTFQYIFENDKDNDIGQVFRTHNILFEIKRALF